MTLIICCTRGCDAMLNATKTVKVTNLWDDSAADTERETVTLLRGCSWHEQYRAAPGTGGLTASGVVKVRIPAQLTAGYTPPDQYVGTGWTLRPGDRLTCDGRTATVLAVHDNRAGALPHLYVEAN